MIVIVDERNDVSEAYRTSLGREGFAVATFRPEDFSGWFHSSSGPDLSAVEAVVLGDFAAREGMARTIKAKGGIPAIALNDAPGLDATLRLFEAGIDDVVRKPVHAREIIARIGAIRRRQVVETPLLWDDGGLRLHGDGRDPEINGTAVQLPRRERRILEYLASNRGRRVSRAQIFNAVYGLFDEAVEESVVESHISKLRKKLRHFLGHDPIDSRRFLGYQLMTVERKLAAA
jgi:DNA-binding response OmpR family regulator